MDGQIGNMWVTAVVFKSKNPPDDLIDGAVPVSKISLDLINVGVAIHHACGHVTVLIDVLADTLDGLDGAAQLYINVGLEYFTDHLVVRNYYLLLIWIFVP